MTWWMWLIVGFVTWLVIAVTVTLVWAMHQSRVVQRRIDKMSAPIHGEVGFDRGRHASRRPLF